MSKDNIRIIFVDGQYRSDLSNLAALTKQVNVDADIFTLQIPKGFHCPQDIYIDHINNTFGSKQMKKFFIAEENSESTIIESYRGDDQREYDNQIEINIELKTNARLHYYKWQQEGKKARHSAQLLAKQASNSYLGTYHVVKGAKFSNDNFSYSLTGEGATCESIGFYQCIDQQKFRIISHIDHLSSYTNSRQLYKGIAKDKSHAVFNGMIMVSPNVREVCAHQRNDNLLLSEQAQVDTKPELEIYSEDVRCSHGATVGQLDAEALFYLCSRGVEKDQARELLIDGFANEVFKAFPRELLFRGQKTEDSGLEV